MRVGITGGIGSGKSTVCDIFRFLGIPVYEADRETRKLYANNASLRQQLADHYGEEVLTKDGVNRQLLREKAFNDPEALKALNELVHPYVFGHYENWCTQHESYPYTLKEAAILFESGSYRRLHAAICVVAPDELRIQRTMNRDGLKREQVLAVMQRQWPQAELERRCNYIIVNDGSKGLINQVLDIHRKLLVDCGKPHAFLPDLP